MDKKVGVSALCPGSQIQSTRSRPYLSACSFSSPCDMSSPRHKSDHIRLCYANEHIHVDIYIHMHIINNLQLDCYIILYLTTGQLRYMTLIYINVAGRNIMNVTQFSDF